MTKIAAIQMCSTRSVAENLESAAQLIQEAASNGARLIVLPENFAIMSLEANDKILSKESFGEGKIQSFLSEQAKKHKAWIVGGTIPIEGKNKNKVRAASLVYDDHGNLVARYDKIHLFDVTLTQETHKESELIEAGEKIVVVDTPFAKLGLAVCYDIRFPELFRAMFNKGVEMFVLPAAFTVPTGEAHWEMLTRSRAIENFCYFVGSCQGGTHHGGRQTYGHSLIIEPWGNIIARKNDNAAGVIYAEFDINKVNQARKSIPVKEHRRIMPNDDMDIPIKK